MKFRNVISTLGVLLSLTLVPAIKTYQAEDSIKAKSKKAKPANPSAESLPSDTNKTAPAKTVSDSEIAAAKADGKVWVNTDTGVYHKGGKWYGATKQGRFMTEQDAIKAGYRAAKTK
jgi:hypothetical protein